MTLTTSSSFASASASGTDWRDISRRVLEQLESVKTHDDQFNIGFLYISDLLAENAESILSLFKSVTGVQSWIGCAGLGVCANDADYVDQPAIAAMVGTLEEGAFQLFPAMNVDDAELEQATAPWLQKNQPMLVYVHGDPLAEGDVAQTLKNLHENIGGFVVGGLASSRSDHPIFSKRAETGGISGAVFSSDIDVSIALSQGCQKMGRLHTVTKCEDHIIYEIDGQSPIDVFEDNIRDFILKKTGQDPDKVEVEEGLPGEGTKIPEEFENLLKGEVHVAFSVPGSDQEDYLVRNIIGMDPDLGTMAVSHQVHVGDHILFCHRDDETIMEELSAMLVRLRERATKERGRFEPKAALYVSCAGRHYSQLHGEALPDSGGGEIALIKEIIGDVPLCGFYAAGEISNNRLYGYTAVLTLFF